MQASSRIVRAAIAVAATILLVGCGGQAGQQGDAGQDSEAAQGSDAGQGGELGTYAGEVAGSELFVALGVDDAGQVLAYACDGNTVGEWFSGPLEGTEVALTSRNGARLEAMLQPDGASGKLTLDDQSLEFTAPPVAETGGLFRAEGEINGQPSLTGWIVLDDGRQKGVTTFAATSSPAPTLSARLVRRRVISPD